MRRVHAIIIVVLVALGAGALFVFIARNRARAAYVTCAENLRRQGVAMYIRVDLKPEEVRAGKVGLGGPGSLPAARITTGYATWAVQLAPFFKTDSELGKWDLSLPFVDQPQTVRETSLAVFLCPARSRSSLIFSGKDGSGAVGDYACASGAGDPEAPWSGPNADGAIIEGEVDKRDGKRIVKWHSRTGFVDLVEDEKRGSTGRGLAYTILIGEKHVPRDGLLTLEAGDGSLYDGRRPNCYARAGGKGFPIAAGPDAPYQDNFGSYHAGFAQFMFADTHVDRMAVDMSEEVLGRLIRR
ncbi:MAG: DUF1559 domain-containing protein [Gemmataceae bacterium]